MSRFLDGPAAGLEFSLRRAPIYVRVVCSSSGKWDVCDQPEDTPEADEEIHIYVRVPGTFGAVFACARSSKRPGGLFEHADYRYVGDGERVRSNEAWNSWCLSQPAARPTIEDWEAATS